MRTFDRDLRGGRDYSTNPPKDDARVCAACESKWAARGERVCLSCASKCEESLSEEKLF